MSFDSREVLLILLALWRMCFKISMFLAIPLGRSYYFWWPIHLFCYIIQSYIFGLFYVAYCLVYAACTKVAVVTDNVEDSVCVELYAFSTWLKKSVKNTNTN